MKNKFITSTIILIGAGFATKILGFLIKIIYTRIILEEGVGLLSLVMPTYSLLITIATLAMPLAISKLVAEGRMRSLKILMSSVIIMILVNSLIMVLMLIGSKFIAFELLKNKNVYVLLIACTLTLPFISISSIIKGYFFGKQKNLPYAISNILEQVLRLILIATLLPYFVKKGILFGVMAFILLNIISETFSIFILLLFAPKNMLIKREDFKVDLRVIKNILDISLPTVSSRLIGNIGFFFEPIILTNILLFVGYDSLFIMREYGAYNAYSIALLSMPSFFVGAISSALVPEISKFYGQRNFKMVKRRFKQALTVSFILGLFFSVIIWVFRSFLLQTLYNTTSGINYIKVLAPFFVLFYLESPIVSTLQGLGMANYTMKVTFWGIIIKNLVLIILSFGKIGIYGLVISEIVDIIFVVFLNYHKIKKVMNNF